MALKKLTFVSKIKISRIGYAINVKKREEKEYTIDTLPDGIKSLNEELTAEKIISSEINSIDFDFPGQMIYTSNIYFSKPKSVQMFNGETPDLVEEGKDLYTIYLTPIKEEYGSNTEDFCIEVFKKIRQKIFSNNSECKIFKEGDYIFMLLPNYDGEVKYINDYSPALRLSPTSRLCFGFYKKDNGMQKTVDPKSNAVNDLYLFMNKDNSGKLSVRWEVNSEPYVELDNSRTSYLCIYYKNLKNLIGNGYHLSMATDYHGEEYYDHNYPVRFFLNEGVTLCKLKNSITKEEKACILSRYYRNININVEDEQYSDDLDYYYILEDGSKGKAHGYINSNFTADMETMMRVKDIYPTSAVLYPIRIGLFYAENCYFSPIRHYSGNTTLIRWYLTNQQPSNYNIKAETLIDGIMINNEEYFGFGTCYQSMEEDANIIYKKI